MKYVLGKGGAGNGKATESRRHKIRRTRSERLRDLAEKIEHETRMPIYSAKQRGAIDEAAHILRRQAGILEGNV